MTALHIALVYFSATGVTQAYARVMRDELLAHGCGVQLFNVTSYASRQEKLPVADFERAGFVVLFSAEFLGRHSRNVGGWRVLPERPDAEDFAVAQEYAALAVESFSQTSPPAFRLQKPFAYDEILALRQSQPQRTERGWANPVRIVPDCCMCRACETECPTQAFAADTGLSDPGLCIECMHCVYICPEKVVKVDDHSIDTYAEWLANWHLTDEMMNAKKSRIITAAWQAAS